MLPLVILTGGGHWTNFTVDHSAWLNQCSFGVGLGKILDCWSWRSCICLGWLTSVAYADKTWSASTEEILAHGDTYPQARRALLQSKNMDSYLTEVAFICVCVCVCFLNITRLEFMVNVSLAVVHGREPDFRFLRDADEQKEAPGAMETIMSWLQ